MAAPIVLFVYNRPQHTLKTLDALQSNIDSDQAEVIVYADGPKSGATDDVLEKIEETRKLFSRKFRFKNLTLIASDKNTGCANSIIHGISETLQAYSKAIILEDDIHTSPYFLRYCNLALDKYELREDVMAISGYVYPIRKKMKHSYFVRTGAAWGWATWARAWKQFSTEPVHLLDSIEQTGKKSIEQAGKKREFNFNNSYDFYKMLEQQRDGEIDAWCIRWYASIFLNNGLCLYPAETLTINIGQDGSGTHYTEKNNDPNFIQQILNMSENPDNYLFPDLLTESEEGRKQFETYFQEISSGGRLQRLKNLVKKLMH